MSSSICGFPLPLTIGTVGLPNRVALAPMTGITDVSFRRMAARLGAGLVVSEMTASRDLVEGRHDAALRAEGQGVGLHVVQLAGCEPRWMGEGARIAEAAGAAIIDINMGCPARSVTGGQSGSALMRDLDHALTLIEATVAAVSVPVTLKMRLGWDDRTINAPMLARRAEAAGVRMITVHGRTRCQFYKGRPDWTAVRAVKDSVAIPVVVNGDIGSFRDASDALAASGADAVMIGRRHARKHLGWALDAAAATTAAPIELLRACRERVLTADDPGAVRCELAAAFDAIGSTRGVGSSQGADSSSQKAAA